MALTLADCEMDQAGELRTSLVWTLCNQLNSHATKRLRERLRLKIINRWTEEKSRKIDRLIKKK